MKLLHANFKDLHSVDSLILYNTTANSTNGSKWALRSTEGHKLAVSFGRSNHDIDSVRIIDVAG
jgi:hypothetical protein